MSQTRETEIATTVFTLVGFVTGETSASLLQQLRGKLPLVGRIDPVLDNTWVPPTATRLTSLKIVLPLVPTLNMTNTVNPATQATGLSGALPLAGDLTMVVPAVGTLSIPDEDTPVTAGKEFRIQLTPPAGITSQTHRARLVKVETGALLDMAWTGGYWEYKETPLLPQSPGDTYRGELQSLLLDPDTDPWESTTSLQVEVFAGPSDPDLEIREGTT